MPMPELHTAPALSRFAAFFSYGVKMAADSENHKLLNKISSPI